MSLHVQFIRLLSMLKLPPYIMIYDIFVVVNMIARSVQPDSYHDNSPSKEKYK